MVDELSRNDAPRLLPQEYQNLVEAYEHGEAVLRVQDNDEEAEAYYLLTLQKGYLLRSELELLKQSNAEKERREAAEKERAEEERLQLEVAKAEEQLREEERLKAAAEASAKEKEREKRLLKDSSAQTSTSYTVRRGESLPQIAGRTEIYNDSALWPLIYRANRDQIRDPKRLWPGQVLFIPRNYSRDEALEARRYSGRK